MINIKKNEDKLFVSYGFREPGSRFMLMVKDFLHPLRLCFLTWCVLLLVLVFLGCPCQLIQSSSFARGLFLNLDENNGKIINLMFGSNAPKLIRLITEELKNEQLIKEGQFERTKTYEITEMTEEEQKRFDAVQAASREEKEIEEEKRKEELHDRLYNEAKNILENLPNVGVVLVFPHAKDKYMDVLHDVLGEAGLVIGYTDKFHMTMEIIEEMLFFNEDKSSFPQAVMDDILHSKHKTIALLIKQFKATDLEFPFDEYLLKLIYGPMMTPPGSPNSPAVRLMSGESKKPEKQIMGIWVPPNALVQASCLKLFFRSAVEQLLIPLPEPTPEHLEIAFEAQRRAKIWKIMAKYPHEVIRYGFFTSEVAKDAKLIAKTMQDYEFAPKKTEKDKLIIQLSKKRSDCLRKFVKAKPVYMSPNTKVGKRECQILFPNDYDVFLKSEDSESNVISIVPDDVTNYVLTRDELFEEESSETESSVEDDKSDMLAFLMHD